MSITVQLTYDMAKEIGTSRLEVSGAKTVNDVLRLTRAHFETENENFEKLTRVAALAVNGVGVAQSQPYIYVGCVRRAAWEGAGGDGLGRLRVGVRVAMGRWWVVQWWGRRPAVSWPLWRV